MSNVASMKFVNDGVVVAEAAAAVTARAERAMNIR